MRGARRGLSTIAIMMGIKGEVRRPTKLGVCGVQLSEGRAEICLPRIAEEWEGGFHCG